MGEGRGGLTHIRAAKREESRDAGEDDEWLTSSMME